MNTKEKFQQIFANNMSSNDAREFLIELYNAGETSQDVTDAVEVMRAHSIKLDLPFDLQDKVVDVVGTGGDKSGSFNISSTVSLLISSIGSYVAKHGNRSITSNSGSADMLEALGINLNLTPKQQVQMLQEARMCFMFAANHHTAMKHIMPIRKSIDHRTIFNIMGPLTNPSSATKYLMGVFSPDYIDIMAETLLSLDTQRAFVVSSNDGMDEISISTTTQFAYVANGKISRGIIDPETHGFNLSPKEEINGGNAIENAQITKAIFNNEIAGAKRDVVVLNSSYALFVDGLARDIQEGIEMADEALKSGKASAHLSKIIKVSNSLSEDETV